MATSRFSRHSRQWIPGIVLASSLLFFAGTPVHGQSAQNLVDQPSIRANENSPATTVSDTPSEATPQFEIGNSSFPDTDIKQPTRRLDLATPPLSVVIVVETSSRIEALLPDVRRTGILFTQTVLGPDGEAALIGYNEGVDRLLDFTGDQDAIDKAVGNFNLGPSGAHLYDALSQAVALLREQPSSRRRVIVVLGEPTDTGSSEQLEHVIRAAQQANITIDSVGLSSTAAQLRGPDEQYVPPSSTPAGSFALPPEPGTAQTPTTEAMRAGNINLGGLAVWGAKHVTSALRDNPMEIAARATDGLYQRTYGDSSIEGAIDKIGGALHAG